MIEVYREKDPVFIPALQAHLEAEGIQTFVRNENLSSVEVNIPVFFPALCIVNEKDIEKAKTIIEPLLKSFKQEDKDDLSTEEITCAKCSEKSPPTFFLCWNCQAEITP